MASPYQKKMMAKRVFGERWGYFLNVPDDLSLLASGIRACSAVEMPEVPQAWVFGPSVCIILRNET